ncbi:MAG: hypothetical protein LH616_09955 [Ilumatobacteraceae bacterium]|nr:hypothetical protein [Ilumatobacteraceae bacterium]
MFLRRIALLLGLVAVATACGAASGQGVDPPDTAAVGGLPAQGFDSSTIEPESVSTLVRTTVPIDENQQIGAKVPGNRVLLIGDSVMASTSQRYGGEMCAALVPLGWQTEVDAETGRFIDFGDQVLDTRLAAGWDVSVILLGNNYGENQDVYRQYLDAIVARLSPQPVVLLTVTEFKSSRAQVNTVIFEMAQKYPNVVVLDWAAVTGATPLLTGADGLHLTDSGRATLAAQVSLVLGDAPVQPGKCLSTGFRDDSSGPVTGTNTTVEKTTRTTTTVAGTGTTTLKTTTPTTTAGTNPPVATTQPPVATTQPPAVTEAPPTSS